MRHGSDKAFILQHVSAGRKLCDKMNVPPVQPYSFYSMFSDHPQHKRKAPVRGFPFACRLRLFGDAPAIHAHVRVVSDVLKVH